MGFERMIRFPGRLRENLHEDIAAVSDGFPQICITGSRQAFVEGKVRIMEYSPTVIRLAAGKGTVCFSGNRLRLRSLNRYAAVIGGEIRSVEILPLSEGGK